MANENYLGLPGFKELLLQTYTYFITRKEAQRKFNTKVDKIEGKGLSEEDFTTALKGKLEGIETGAEVNRIATFTIDNVEQPVTNKILNIHIPLNVSELSNDKKYQTLDEVDKSIKDAFDKFTSLEFRVVDALPDKGENGVFYLVRHDHTDKDDANKDLYDEFVWNTSQQTFEKIGNTDIDLTPVTDAIKAEETRATAAEDQLRTDLTAETTAREQGDKTLNEAINKEVDDRKTAIQESIDKIGTFTMYVADYDDELLVCEDHYVNKVQEDKTEVTASDRAFWNNKVTSYVSDSEGDDGTIETTGENLVLTKTNVWGEHNNGGDK